MTYQPSSGFERVLIDLLTDPEIMEFSDEVFAKRGLEDPEVAPCTHDDDYLCVCRIRAFARKIATHINETNYVAAVELGAIPDSMEPSP